jgi:hypothetical protein
VVFTVSVTSNPDATLDSVVAALAVLGITAGNFSSTQVVSVSFGGEADLHQLWAFTLPAPLSKLKDTISSLTSLQQTIAQKNAGLSMTFHVQGTQASPQPCSTPDLVSDARAQAQKLANAAGLSIGPVIGISDAGSSSLTAVAANRIPTPLAGDFSTFLVNTPLFAIAPIPPFNCSLVVQFRMLR